MHWLTVLFLLALLTGCGEGLAVVDVDGDDDGVAGEDFVLEAEYSRFGDGGRGDCVGESNIGNMSRRISRLL